MASPQAIALGNPKLTPDQNQPQPRSKSYVVHMADTLTSVMTTLVDRTGTKFQNPGLPGLEDDVGDGSQHRRRKQDASTREGGRDGEGERERGRGSDEPLSAWFS